MQVQEQEIKVGSLINFAGGEDADQVEFEVVGFGTRWGASVATLRPSTGSDIEVSLAALAERAEVIG